MNIQEGTTIPNISDEEEPVITMLNELLLIGSWSDISMDKFRRVTL